jgi:zinc protease
LLSKRFLAALAFFFLLLDTACVVAQTLPNGVQKVTSTEGITEYSFSNGLHVLLFPDSSQPKITVNVTYRVGSRSEGYGETGMAHLLEHMTFKSSKSGKELFKELTDRAGGFFNGMTSYDQTIYFESFNASDDNLRWALGLEADRMVNMTMLKKDLDTEMTVVRNEMEAGENNPVNVLDERVLAAAYNFHNYGKTVIGARSDVERVPIENLAVFYRKYYQPDNADLIVSGKFDESNALAMIAQTLGSIPRPDRVLPQPYTTEPTQEGEREVILRRVGSLQAILAVYHIPAALHPDIAALQVLAQVLGAPQTGRLYKDLVDGKKAVSTYMYTSDMHDPGYVLAYAQLKPEQSVDDAAQSLLKGIENLAANPPTQEEVDRAKARILKNIELSMTNSQSVAIMLGGYVGDGDWRLLFLNRDEVAKVTPADVTRVAKAYLKPSNRTLGEFIPTAAPDRAEIAAAPDVATRFKDFKASAAIQEGEAFDPTPKNIEARLIRATLPNGMKLVMFPKKTRGGIVVVNMNFRYGNEKSLFGTATAATMAGGLLMRGTKTKNRQQIQDETDRLKAQMNVWGKAGYGGAWMRTVEANLPDSLRLARELLREPSFPEAEFEQVRQQSIASAESQKTEPAALAQNEMYRHIDAQYPKGDVRYVATLDEQIEELKHVTLEDARKYYNEFYAPAEGEIIVSGQFNPEQVQKQMTTLFGDWKSNKPYERLRTPFKKRDTINHKVETPDKQNAMFMAGMTVKMDDEDPDYPAITMGGMILGGSANSRLFQRIRVKDGLSYGAYSQFYLPTRDDGGAFYASAIAAPQNMPKVEAAFQEEVATILKNGVTADELEKAKKTWLDQRMLQRADEGNLAGVLESVERWGRTIQWDEQLEAKVSALTPEQVNAALKRHFDPTQLSIVKGGDFKKANVYQESPAKQ